MLPQDGESPYISATYNSLSPQILAEDGEEFPGVLKKNTSKASIQTIYLQLTKISSFVLIIRLKKTVRINQRLKSFS
jgi:hypothetical protein